MTLKLEGQVVSQWVGELETHCERLLAERKRVVLDLKEVTLVDRRAASALRNLAARHVRIVNCRGLIEEVLNESDVS